MSHVINYTHEYQFVLSSSNNVEGIFLQIILDEKYVQN